MNIAKILSEKAELSYLTQRVCNPNQSTTYELRVNFINKTLSTHRFFFFSFRIDHCMFTKSAYTSLRITPHASFVYFCLWLDRSKLRKREHFMGPQETVARIYWIGLSEWLPRFSFIIRRFSFGWNETPIDSELSSKIWNFCHSFFEIILSYGIPSHIPKQR